MITMSFGLSAVLLIISLSAKTLLLSLRVALRALEASVKAAKKAGKQVADSTGLSDSGVATAVRQTRATVGKAAGAVKKTGELAVKTGKATVKTAKMTGKVATKAAKFGKKTVELTIKAIKLAIRALQLLINIIHSVVAFLLSLGVVGIVILVIIVVALIGAVAGALLSISSVPGGGFTVGAGADGLGVPILGGVGGITGQYNPGGVNGGIIGGLPGQPQDPSNPGGVTVIVPGDTTALYNACKQMADWYLANVTTYSAPSTKYYNCPLLNKKVGDSCAYFASSYACLVSDVNIMQGSSGQWYKTDTPTVTALKAAGWVRYTMTEIGGVAGLKPGDILVSPKGAKNGIDPLITSGYGHCEVYLGEGQSFGWGRVQSKFPSSTTKLTDVVKKNSSGTKFLYAGDGGYHYYGVVWRYGGG